MAEVYASEPFGLPVLLGLALDCRRGRAIGRYPIREGCSASTGGGFEIEESFAGEFGDNGIRVPEEEDQHADPREFIGSDTDHLDGAGHRGSLSTISSDGAREG